MIVGFGTYREGLEVLMRGLERDDERLLMHVCRQGRALEGGPRDQLTYLRTFLESLAGRHERYFAAAREDARDDRFTGRLEHGELARVLPCGRGDGRAEHVSRGVRDGGGRGAPPAARSRSAPATRASPRWPASWARRSRPRCAQLLTFERGMRAVEDLAPR